MAMKDNVDIDEILARYFSGEADSDTLEKLNKWLDESPDHRKQFELLKSVWLERSPEPKSVNTPNREALERIWQKGTQQNGKGKGFFSFNIITHFPQIAAALLVVITIPFVVHWINAHKQTEEAKPAHRFITKENPATQRSRFLLPDGSMVWLNCQSSLRYPENFSSAERHIELTGEAFFEVKEDTLRPFVVTSGNISTTALGTSFNVAAYPEKAIIEVSLITGKVRIDDRQHNELAVLDPGLGISYNKGNSKITRRKINSDDVLAWKSGVLVFDGDDYEEFVRKIKQWYGVEVTTIGNVPGNWRIRGRFDNAYLTSILEVISFNKDFKYHLDDKVLTIQFKRNIKS
jgi:ferric-dicitrate binding protein FerR (iron transport regulator)